MGSNDKQGRERFDTSRLYEEQSDTFDRQVCWMSKKKKTRRPECCWDNGGKVAVATEIAFTAKEDQSNLPAAAPATLAACNFLATPKHAALERSGLCRRVVLSTSPAQRLPVPHANGLLPEQPVETRTERKPVTGEASQDLNGAIV